MDTEKTDCCAGIRLPKGQSIVRGETLIDNGSQANASDSERAAFCKLIMPDQPGLEATANADCAGENTRATARIAAYPYQMSIRFAQGPDDALARARKCRNDVIDATYWNFGVLICAPYIGCDA